MRRWWLAFCLLAAGCAPAQPLGGSATPAAHEHKAPHGGTLVELGEELAHLELLWNEKDANLTVYVIDGECENPVRIRQSKWEISQAGKHYWLQAQANPLTSETVGDSSQFSGQLPVSRGKSQWKAELVQLQLLGQTFQGLGLNYP